MVSDVDVIVVLTSFSGKDPAPATLTMEICAFGDGAGVLARYLVIVTSIVLSGPFLDIVVVEIAAFVVSCEQLAETVVVTERSWVCTMVTVAGATSIGLEPSFEPSTATTEYLALGRSTGSFLRNGRASERLRQRHVIEKSARERIEVIDDIVG